MMETGYEMICVAATTLAVMGNMLIIIRRRIYFLELQFVCVVTVEQWFCFYVVCILPNFSPEGTLCNFAKMGLFSLLAMQSAPCRVDRVSWIFPYCGTCLLCSLTC